MKDQNFGIADGRKADVRKAFGINHFSSVRTPEHDRVHFLQEVRLLVLQFPLPPSRSRPQYAIHFLVVAERRRVGSSCPARVLLRVFRVSVGVRLSMSTSHFFSMPLSHLVFLPPRPSPPPGYGFTTVCLALPRALPPSAAVRRFFYLSFGNEDTISGQDTP